MKLWNGTFVFEAIDPPQTWIVDVTDDGNSLSFLGGQSFVWNEEFRCYETGPFEDPEGRLYVLAPDNFLIVYEGGEPPPVVGKWRPE